jgi:REP element-mobilizing transposase RayT
MKLFKSHDPNTFHYTTSVCYRRVPVFRSDKACQLFVEALAETRRRFPLKLIGYVVMPDHTHLIINPVNRDISAVMNSLKSAVARKIIDWLKEFNHASSLRKLALETPQKRGHTHSVWQKDFSSIDLWSPKFIRQKLNYIHLNPVRAGLCKHPAEWRWSSYRAYLPHESSDVPIEMNLRGYWSEDDLESVVGPAGDAHL